MTSFNQPNEPSQVHFNQQQQYVETQFNAGNDINLYAGLSLPKAEITPDFVTYCGATYWGLSGGFWIAAVLFFVEAAIFPISSQIILISEMAGATVGGLPMALLTGRQYIRWIRSSGKTVTNQTLKRAQKLAGPPTLLFFIIALCAFSSAKMDQTNPFLVYIVFAAIFGLGFLVAFFTVTSNLGFPKE